MIGGRTIQVMMAEFEDGVLFTNVMKLPGAELRAHHEVLPNPTSPTTCTLRNRVHISGPTSWIFGKVIGRNMNDEHGAMLRAVAKRAAELA